MCDLDGTLVDTSRLYFEGVPPIVAKHLGIQAEARDLLPLWGRLARHFFAHFAARAGAPEAAVDAMYAEFEGYYNEAHNRLATVYDGVPEALARLRREGLKVGVVTTRPSRRGRPVLAMELARQLDFIVWGDRVARAKPAPDGLELALAAHGDPARGGFYIGDTANDVAAVRRCRHPVRAAAALWDAMDRDGLRAAGPDAAFERFADFADWVLADVGKIAKGNQPRRHKA